MSFHAEGGELERVRPEVVWALSTQRLLVAGDSTFRVDHCRHGLYKAMATCPHLSQETVRIFLGGKLLHYCFRHPPGIMYSRNVEEERK